MTKKNGQAFFSSDAGVMSSKITLFPKMISKI